MIEFATYVGETWNISFDIAETICRHFEENESLFFVTDYVPLVATQVEFDTVSEIYSFLDLQKSLAPYREKTRNILKKADLFDDDAAYKIELSISAAELDDIAIAHRTGVRTRGIIAAGKGVLPCADTIDEQASEGDLEKLLGEYVGKDESLQTAENVRDGVRDILAERYGYDENARIMVREFVEDEGYVEVLIKKKAKKYEKFRDVQVDLRDLTDEDILTLREGEAKKDLKVKVGAQLFQIDDLLHDYFIENPDAIAIDLIHEAINDAWSRLLQPMVEESVKDHMITRAENRAACSIKKDLRAKIREFVSIGKQTFLVVAAYSETELELLTVDNNGLLLRASKEPIREFGRAFVSTRMKQMMEQYRPAKVAVLNNKYGEAAMEIVNLTVDSIVSSPEISKIAGTTKITSLLKSEFLKSSSEQLEENTLKTYAYSLVTFMPLSLLPEIGYANFSIHPMQPLLGDEKMGEVVDELLTAASLRRGVELGKKQDTLLIKAGITEKNLEALREARKNKKINSKSDIQNIEGISQSDYNNVAGYLVFPNSDFVLDKSTVHPAEYSLVESICSEIGVSSEDLPRDITKLENFKAEDESVGRFVSEKISEQIVVAKRYISLSSRPKRKLRLGELRIDAIVDGRVTNITPFGVFVDINAMSDGLVHISELTSDYVESAEQVVAVGDQVRVKIIEVNKKKRRISLSMKQADNNGLRVSASRTQLNDLANFFNKM